MSTLLRLLLEKNADRLRLAAQTDDVLSRAALVALVSHDLDELPQHIVVELHRWEQEQEQRNRALRQVEQEQQNRVRAKEACT